VRTEQPAAAEYECSRHLPQANLLAAALSHAGTPSPRYVTRLEAGSGKQRTHPF